MKLLIFLLIYIRCQLVIAFGSSSKTLKCVHGNFNKTTEICNCFSGWKGPACNDDIDECKLNYCHKNSTVLCKNTPGGVNCTCKTGWEGKQCDHKIDTCYPNPCSKSGKCVPHLGWHECVCYNDSVGADCSITCPPCSKNTSYCAYDELKRRAYCRCKTGHKGEHCTEDLNECAIAPQLCKNGICRNTGGGYECDCFRGWEGKHCKNKTNYCKNITCEHGGICESLLASFSCKCKHPYTGEFCKKLKNPCKDVTCENGGTCKPKGVDDHYCKCPKNFNGTHCEKELPCHKAICKNNGTCHNVGTAHKCRCKPGWTGNDCSKNSSCKPGICKNGGHCIEKEHGTYKCQCLNGFDGKNCEKVVKEKCLNPHCSEHIGKCREECNTHACDWDGKICSLGVLPWQNCSAHKCWQKFGNGKCDPECNTDVCSFDGHDCGNLHKSNCSDDVYCKKVFGDGICNTVCNTPECGFDGNDCEDKPKHKYVPGDLIITIRSTKEEFEKKKNEFVRYLSLLLNARVIIEEIVEIVPEDDVARKKRAAVYRRGTLKIRMKIDNGKCSEDCFKTATSAANFIAAKKARGKLQHLPFKMIEVTSKPEKKIFTGRISPLWIASCVAVPLLLLGVIAFTRKVVTRLWHPEGDNRFAVNDMRREPLGQEGDEMTNLQRRESVSGGSHVSPSGSCSDSPNSVNDAKRMKVEMVGSLGSSDWLNVKGVLREQADSPGGVVHIPAANLDGSLPEPSCGDTDGETNLHVAARLAKTELARQLIEFGVDINARNKSGKTPLHLAVSSLADGVFQLLIRNRACQIDVQDYEGRTALMSACHCCHNMMVDELISNGAKVNLVDSQGKTALHCAAMVDNHKAVLVLLKNGAKVDAQDNKGQTPLFLAARDGAYTTAYVLLANYANRNCADSMDVTPLTISHQRGQKDLVALLSDWTGSPPGMMTSPSRNSPPDLSSPSSGTISPTPCSQYSDIRPKLPSSFGQMSNGNVTNSNNNNPIKPPMKRKRKSTKGAKEKSPIEKNHHSFMNNYPTSIGDVYATSRSSMDKREGGLPELNSAEILEGMSMYPALEQINNLPTNWSNSLMSGVHGPSHGHGPGHGPTHGPGHGHYQFTNPVLQNNRQFQFPQQTYVNPYDNCIPGNTFPTPPSVDIESPHDMGSPIDQLNVLPSPFLTPSPENWSNSPGNSDNSAC